MNYSSTKIRHQGFPGVLIERRIDLFIGEKVREDEGTHKIMLAQLIWFVRCVDQLRPHFFCLFEEARARHP
jgi:hypothetical protein